MNKIKFVNKCSVPGWMSDDRKEFRENSNDFFERAINSSELFDNEEIEVEYFLRGVGSIVGKISTKNSGIYVMKTTESINRTRSEIHAYRAMEDNGIKVPKLFYHGTQNDSPFFIMEFVDNPTLEDKLRDGDMTVENVADIKSSTFLALQDIPGKGYGWITDYRDGFVIGQFDGIEGYIKDWFRGDLYLKAIVDNFPGVAWKEKLESRLDLVRESNTESGTHLGTFDFQDAHFFATEPPTFFDIGPRLEPEYFDLGRALLPEPSATKDHIFAKGILVKRLINEVENVSVEEIKTAIWLQTYRKAASILSTPDEERIRRAGGLLEVISTEENLDNYFKMFLE